MRRPTKILAASLILSMAVAAPGCTAMHRIQAIDSPAPPPAFGHIESGDLVSVVMKDGRKVSFEVAHAYPDRLLSVDGEQFSRVDMARLDHDRISLGRSLGLAGGIALGVLVLSMFLESIGFGGT